jgi:hypothetical protein
MFTTCVHAMHTMHMHVVERPSYSFISRTNAAMHITFSYDPAVELPVPQLDDVLRQGH